MKNNINTCSIGDIQILINFYFISFIPGCRFMDWILSYGHLQDVLQCLCNAEKYLFEEKQHRK